MQSLLIDNAAWDNLHSKSKKVCGLKIDRLATKQTGTKTIRFTSQVR
jgi:hypothetical protein